MYLYIGISFLCVRSSMGRILPEALDTLGPTERAHILDYNARQLTLLASEHQGTEILTLMKINGKKTTKIVGTQN